MTTNEFTPFVWIDRHNHSLIKEILNPNFNGDTELDSTLNQAEVHIHQAGEIIVNYPQGAFPLDVAKSAVDSTNALLKLYRKKYGIAIAKPVEQAFHAYFNMWYYSGNPLFPGELYKKKFFQCEEKLFTAIRTGNVALSSFIQKPPQKRKRPEVSVTDAANALNVSTQTIRNWEQSGCPFSENYPGRFNAPIFYQWAKSFTSLKNFNREAKKRALLMNKL